MLNKRSFENKSSILLSNTCGCYYCLNTYRSSKVKEYVKDKNGFTAVCPKCGIDSVVAYDSHVDGLLETFKTSLAEQYEKSFGV
jgi:hypothetical protein